MSSQVFHFSEGTPAEVQKALIRAYHSGNRVRIWYGDKDGTAWLEEHDVTGTIGRSTGPKHIPLRMANRGSIGGGGVLTDCIVRIDDSTNKSTLYKNPALDLGSFRVEPCDLDGYTTSVYVTKRGAPEQLHANFKKPEQAQRWIGFMTGKRYCK